MNKLLHSCLIIQVVAFFVGCESDSRNIHNDQLVGDNVVLALEKYKADRDTYPDVLSELEPNYIGSIKQPRYGERRWDYIHYCKNDTFGLGMWGRRSTDKGYVYSSERRKWELADNSF